MVGGQFEFGGDDCLRFAGADQPGVGPGAKRQAEAVEQDRLSGAGFAGQHAKARLELQLEPVDQHHIADRQLPQHPAADRVDLACRLCSGSLRHVPLDQIIAALIPFAAGVVGAKHGGRLLRFQRQAEVQIGLDQPLQRLGCVAWWSDICR